MRQTFALLALAVLPVAFTACVHTPPGTSVEVALAKRAEVVRLAAAKQVPPDSGSRSSVTVSPVEPRLPQSDVIDRVNEATSRGDFLRQTGNEREAIAAYEEAVRIDPSLVGVWQTLAGLYERSGDMQKAIEAARRSKKIARH